MAKVGFWLQGSTGPITTTTKQTGTLTDKKIKVQLLRLHLFLIA